MNSLQAAFVFTLLAFALAADPTGNYLFIFEFKLYLEKFPETDSI